MKNADWKLKISGIKRFYFQLVTKKPNWVSYMALLKNLAGSFWFLYLIPIQADISEKISEISS